MTKTSQYLRNVGAMFRLLGRAQRLGILLRVLSLFCGVAIPFVIIKYQRALVENIEAGTGEKILISVAAVVSVMLVQKIVDALLSLLEGMLNDSLAVKLERVSLRKAPAFSFTLSTTPICTRKCRTRAESEPKPSRSSSQASLSS